MFYFPKFSPSIIINRNQRMNFTVQFSALSVTIMIVRILNIFLL